MASAISPRLSGYGSGPGTSRLLGIPPGSPTPIPGMIGANKPRSVAPRNAGPWSLRKSIAPEIARGALLAPAAKAPAPTSNNPPAMNCSCMGRSLNPSTVLVKLPRSLSGCCMKNGSNGLRIRGSRNGSYCAARDIPVPTGPRKSADCSSPATPSSLP